MISYDLGHWNLEFICNLVLEIWNFIIVWLLGFRILNLFGAWDLVLGIYLRRNVAADP